MGTSTMILGSAAVGMLSVATLFYRYAGSGPTDRRTTTKQWADGPYRLIKTPRAVKGDFDLSKETGARREATVMALVHNFIIRGLNCIVLQAPNIPASSPRDIADFMTMASTWSMTLHLHHSNEEKYFFNWIEDDLGVEHGSVLGDNVKQHHAFSRSHKAFDDYVAAVKEGRVEYDGRKVLDLIERFIDGPEGLYVHLVEEVATFEALEKYGNRIDWVKWAKGVEKEAVDNGDWEHEMPWVMANLDLDFENGIHRSVWPPFPWFIGWLLRLRYYPMHEGAWRFCCCDAWGRRKDLVYV